MGELIVRLLFCCILVLLYIAGLLICPTVERIWGIQIDLKLLLPLLSLVFLDSWLRLFADFMCSINLRERLKQGNKLIFKFQVTYTGRNVLAFGIESVEGLKDINAELIKHNSDGGNSGTSMVPENLVENLGVTNPCLAFSLICSFRAEPIPTFTIPLLCWDVYKLRIRFRVGDTKKRRMYFMKVHRR